MNCTFANPCNFCFTHFGGIITCSTKLREKKKMLTKRVFRLHLHPVQKGKGYVVLALHRALGVPLKNARNLVRYGGWVPESAGKHADELMELARRIDRLAKAPVAVVR